jgi:hypothetical protein
MCVLLFVCARGLLRRLHLLINEVVIDFPSAVIEEINSRADALRLFPARETTFGKWYFEITAGSV